jgi:hypothetical protein
LYEIVEILHNGNPEDCIDLVFLPEGYRETEMNDFISSCNTLINELFVYSPYKEYRNKFNVWAVKAPSVDSGIDIPNQNIWKNTILNSTFSTFDIDRYCMTEDFASVRNVASSFPYDYVYIIVNTGEYGGGAIYNWYGMSRAEGGYILAHELGHLFAGLGDEYVDDSALNEMYPLNVEPYEANLTTLVDFSSKWEDLVEQGTPIPTPETPQYSNKVGAFEGGGYVNEGVYRPYQHCMMRDYAPFCPVCLRAMCEVFDNLTGTATRVATPIFSPEAGTYASIQNVEISCTTEGAIIYYTTDGSAPTSTSMLYSSAISVNTTTTIKAFAVKSGMTDSGITEAVYTIDINPSISTKEIKIVLHPNPANDFLYFIANMKTEKPFNVIITDISGKIIKKQEVTDKIYIKKLPKGSYTISFYQEKQLIDILKFIKGN